MPLFIKPDWPAPSNIKALCTTRAVVDADAVPDAIPVTGASQSPYQTFNLATHVGDNVQSVEQNRQTLNQQACLPNSPLWLDQQHTVEAICLDGLNPNDWQPAVADASWTTQLNQVSVVMTADCIPLLITNQRGTLVCSIHAGWRGLADGIVSNTLRALPDKPENLFVWIGPCIRQDFFEIGADVYDIFCAQTPSNQQFFKIKTPTPEAKYLGDLAGLLNLELKRLGVNQVYDSGLCSYKSAELFYSYRRDGITGRMASLIWIES